MEIDLNTACDRIELFAREGRLTGGEWHDERDGRELACIYGSIDPSISSIDDCPASLGPRWLHELVINLFDGLDDDDTRNTYGMRYAQALRKTANWTPERWEAARIEFLCLSIDSALNSAKAVAETADYWLTVDKACEQVKRALRGDGDLTAAADAAYAVARAADYAADRAAAYAAYTVARTAYAIAGAGAGAAADAAYAVARAADYAAASTSYAVNSAAAYAALFDALIDLLNS